MKQVYAVVSRALMVIGILTIFLNSQAQNETTTVNGNCGVVTENFNNGTGGWTSPSVYGNVTFDSSFYYNSIRGYWTEMGSTLPGKQTPNAFPRVVNIVSPPYQNPNPVGTFNVGFYYIVPNPDVDMFHVSLIRLTTVSSPGGDITYEELVARSGFKTFSSFSIPSPYTDPVNPLHNGSEGAVCVRLVDPDITGGANITYRVEVTYYVFEGNFTAFDDFSLGDVEAAPLPVNFLGFFARKENGGIKLLWNVAEEHNVRGYEVERSTDGVSFSNIGFVPANAKNIYTFMDGQSSPGTNYYRVRNVDYDGHYKYTNIVKVTNNKASSIKLYPLPAKSQVFLQHDKALSGSMITINSADGRLVKRITPSTNSMQTAIDVSTLKPGLYFVKFDDGTGTVENVKMIKN